MTVYEAPPPKRRIPTVVWVLLVLGGLAGAGLTVLRPQAEQLYTYIHDLIFPPVEGPTVFRSINDRDGVLVRFEVSPKDARLMLDGDPLVSNPVRLKRGKKRHTIIASADGHEPEAREFVDDTDQIFTMTLKKSKN